MPCAPRSRRSEWRSVPNRRGRASVERFLWAADESERELVHIGPRSCPVSLWTGKFPHTSPEEGVRLAAASAAKRAVPPGRAMRASWPRCHGQAQAPAPSRSPAATPAPPRPARAGAATARPRPPPRLRVGARTGLPRPIAAPARRPTARSRGGGQRWCAAPRRRRSPGARGARPRPSPPPATPPRSRRSRPRRGRRGAIPAASKK